TNDFRGHVLHVAEFFHGHQVPNADRPKAGDAADIVPMEVNKHRVFRALFRIAQELPCKFLVFGVIRAASYGAGKRSCRHFAIAKAEKEFWRCPDYLFRTEFQIVHERRRIYLAQLLIYRYRISRNLVLALESDFALESVACPYLLFHAIY